MAGIGSLIYRVGGADNLIYRAAGADAGHLVYRAANPGDITISFAWNGDGRDLDLCAYFLDLASWQFGYGYNYSTDEAVYTNGNYSLTYSGDIRGVAASEYFIIPAAVAKLDQRMFRVHLNYYSYGVDYPLSTCTVVAAQKNGKTVVLENVACSTSNGRKANTNDPYITVNFNADGKLTSIA